jgi:hypothetical protein
MNQAGKHGGRAAEQDGGLMGRSVPLPDRERGSPEDNLEPAKREEARETGAKPEVEELIVRV